MIYARRIWTRPSISVPFFSDADLLTVDQVFQDKIATGFVSGVTMGISADKLTFSRTFAFNDGEHGRQFYDQVSVNPVADEATTKTRDYFNANGIVMTNVDVSDVPTDEIPVDSSKKFSELLTSFLNS